MTKTTKEITPASDLSRKAFRDTTKYDPLEVAYALTDDVLKQLLICAESHCEKFDQPSFCLGLYIAGDPLLKNLRRHKYCAFPWLPEPRPQQSVYLFTKATQKIKRLWSLPNAACMAVISEMGYVAPQWQETKAWCDAFFNHTFFETIRGRNDLSMLSQNEWLDAHKSEVGDLRCDEVKGNVADTFDFSKIFVKQVIDQDKAI